MKKNHLAFTVLDRALTTKRPHGAESTRKFCAWLRKMITVSSEVDGCGNIHVDLRFGTSKSLFVAHVDTVHRAGGKNKVIKTEKQWSACGAPLGADDGAGVATLMHMIAHKIPGYYIFTQGEEVGGVGAGWLAHHKTDLLKQFSRAVAFDRRMTYSVITHQGGSCCASEEFANKLSDEFNNRGMLFAPDDTGVYTDTAEFTQFIPECTNVSIGYDAEHSERETLDIEHFTEMLSAVLKVKWEELPTVRDPNKVDRFDAFAFYGPVRKSGKLRKPQGKGTPVSAYDSWMQNEVGYGGYGGYDAGAGLSSDNYSSGHQFDKPRSFECEGHVDPDTASNDKEFNEAMEAAFDDNLSPLVKMIARAVEPEFPALAEKQISKRMITEYFLINMWDDSLIMDTHTLMVSAFEEIAVVV